jgi:hypothetical protein
MRITFEADSLVAITGEIHAFLAALERPGRGAPSSGSAHTGSALPSCPAHLVEMVYHPAGRGRGGRRVSASYRCPRDGCRGTAIWLD